MLFTNATIVTMNTRRVIIRGAVLVITGNRLVKDDKTPASAFRLAKKVNLLLKFNGYV